MVEQISVDDIQDVDERVGPTLMATFIQLLDGVRGDITMNILVNVLVHESISRGVTKDTLMEHVPDVISKVYDARMQCADVQQQ